MKNINVIDMFCGGGGESTGIFEAALEMQYRPILQKQFSGKY